MKGDDGMSERILDLGIDGTSVGFTMRWPGDLPRREEMIEIDGVGGSLYLKVTSVTHQVQATRPEVQVLIGLEQVTEASTGVVLAILKASPLVEQVFP